MQQAKLHEAVEEALRSALQVLLGLCMRVNSTEVNLRGMSAWTMKTVCKTVLPASH